MTKLYSNFLLFIILQGYCFADLFPYKVGNTWKFQYGTVSGGMIGTLTDSGKVDWEVLSVGVLETIPLQYRISIKQTKTLERRIQNYYVIDPSINYDSTYNPPRVLSTDTFTVNGIEGVNGFTRDKDTCWSFIHDESSLQNQDQVSLTKKQIDYKGNSLEAFQVDPAPCRSPSGGGVIGFPNHPPEYFTLSHDLGPVAYFKGSHPLLLDYMYAENWSLVESNVTSTSISSLVRFDLNKIIFSKNGTLQLESNLGPINSLEAVLLDGSVYSLISRLIPQVDTPQIQLPWFLTDQQVWFLKINTTQGPEFRKVVNKP